MVNEVVDGTLVPRQVALFDLHGEDITLTDSSGTGLPEWLDKKRLLDFKKEHTGSTSLTKAQIRMKDVTRW